MSPNRLWVWMMLFFLLGQVDLLVIKAKLIPESSGFYGFLIVGNTIISLIIAIYLFSTRNKP